MATLSTFLHNCSTNFSDADVDAPLVVVVCGGNMASFELYEDWQKQLGMQNKEKEEK